MNGHCGQCGHFRHLHAAGRGHCEHVVIHSYGNARCSCNRFAQRDGSADGVTLQFVALGAAIARLAGCPHGHVMYIGAGYRLCQHCGAVNGERGQWEPPLYVAELLAAAQAK